eukprot:6166591-Pyramimonas_sp.AAC.1
MMTEASPERRHATPTRPSTGPWPRSSITPDSQAASTLRLMNSAARLPPLRALGCCSLDL